MEELALLYLLKSALTPSVMYFFIYFFAFFIVVQVQWSQFFLYHFPLPHLPPPPVLSPYPFSFVLGSFIRVP